MANLVTHISSISITADRFEAWACIVTDTGVQTYATLQLPVSTLSLNAAQINAALLAQAEEFMNQNFQLTVGGGEKHTLLGGVV